MKFPHKWLKIYGFWMDLFKVKSANDVHMVTRNYHAIVTT